MTSKYGKFEANFSVTTSATNLQVPYDPAPPLGVTAGYGLSVDVLFLAPGLSDWSQAIVWPAFWYQTVTLATVSGQQQGIVTGSGTWKVRAQLQQTGTWQARTRVTDANGTVLGTPSSFSVSGPVAGSHGPLRVSISEPSVFEFTDGTPYWPVGVNGDNTSTLASKYTSNVNLLRIWFSSQCLFGSNHGDNALLWVPLNITDFDHFIQPASAGGPTLMAYRLVASGSSTVALETFNTGTAATQAYLSCKRSTAYRFSCWINTSGVSGTGTVTVKLGPFLSSTTVTSGLAGITDSRRVITTTAGSAPTTWTQFTGTYTTGASEDFFGGGTGGANPFLYLALEGSTTGYAEIANLQIQENLGGGNFGPNQVDMCSGALDVYSQLGSAMVDSIVADAESKGIAIKAVLEDKGDVSWHYFNGDGTITFTSGVNINIYNDLNTTQSGWYQKAFARYCTARWGYSNAIHSWEHVNEGDGGSAQETFTDQLASYFKSIDPNKHMVSTSVAAGVNAPFWAGMPNVDYDDFHAYVDTGELGGVDWQLPPVDNAGTHHWTQPSAGTIQMDCTLTQSWSLPCVVQEAGVWTVSAQINAQSTTGGTFGFTGPSGISQLIAAGTVGFQSVSATWTQASPALATVNFLLGAGTHTGGTGQIQNWAITSPSGKRMYTFIGDGTFPIQTDITKDAAVFHTAYDNYATAHITANSREGQGVKTRPVVRGEWDIGTAGNNTYTSGLPSDTNLAWLHTSVWAGLASGNLYELWWPFSPNLIDSNSGWGKFAPFLSFVSGLPLNNGHYVDIAATQSGQTNGAVIIVGQKDTTNNKAHLWLRHNKFTWNNAVNAPTSWLPGGVAGQILTGTVQFSGFANGTYTVSTNQFDATGALTTSSSSLTVSSGTVSLNLSSLSSTTTDVAYSIVPTTIVPSGPYALIRSG